ncbi:CDP-alcohol phosphatidyltransferase family protein [archaeon]|nr:CDP-alcohol phosphatidyltransferase family protein [archaeon]
MKIKYSMAEIRGSHKIGRNWVHTFLLKPTVMGTTWLVANFTNISPNTISAISGLFYIVCGYFFLTANLPWHLFWGAVFFYLGILLDAVDGKIARLKNKSSKFGAWFDSYIDVWGQSIAAITLGYGYFLYTGNHVWLLLGGVMLFIKFHHNLESNVALQLMGEKNYERRISKDNLGQTGLIGKIKGWLLKKGLRDPVSGSDIKVLFFVIGPMFLILDYILMIIIPIFLIKAVIWFFYYKKELMLLDK